MSAISVSMDGNTSELIERLKRMSDIDKGGIMRSIAEGFRTSTVERFAEEKSPEGERWSPSVRSGQRSRGKTLTKSGRLKTSIHARANDTGFAVGTNTIYAATHQFGDSRTIRAKNAKNLRFQIGDRWVSVPSVDVTIPARPFLGISSEDEAEMKEILEEIFRE